MSSTALPPWFVDKAAAVVSPAWMMMMMLRRGWLLLGVFFTCDGIHGGK